MWETLSNWWQRLWSNPQELSMPDEIAAFAGGNVSIEAFTDPARLPPAQAAALIDAVVAARPDADQLRQTLSVRFIKEHGIDMYGTAVQDHFALAPSDPDLNPNTLYVAPYARPTAGALGMLAARDAQGETYVALVKNWNNPKDHSQGIQPFWRFPGGYMNPRQPNDPEHRPYDHNLDATLQRELNEELGIDIRSLGVPVQSIDVRSECGADRNKPTHAIDAFYLIDATGQSASLPAIAAKDDVAEARWVRLRDIAHDKDRATITIEGKTEAFSPDQIGFLNAGSHALFTNRTQQKDAMPHASWQQRTKDSSPETGRTLH